MFRLLVLKGDTEVYFNAEDRNTPIEGGIFSLFPTWKPKPRNYIIMQDRRTGINQ